MAFDPDAYLAEGGGVKETPFDPDAYLGIEKPVGTSIGQEILQIPAALKQSFGQPLEAMGETAQVAGFPAVATALKGAIQEPEGYVSAGQRFMEPQEGEFQIAGFAPQYAPRAVAEQTGQILYSIGSRIVGKFIGRGVGGLLGPTGGTIGGAAGEFVGPAAIAAAQVVGPVALERAKNNGYTEPTDEDMAYAISTAVVSGALDSFATRFLPGGKEAVGPFFKRLASSFLGQSVPEGLQSFAEQIGGTIETEKGIQVNPKQAIGEALIGGAAGAAATTIAAPFTPEQIEEAKITESANKEAENLVIGNDNPQGKAVLANKQKLEQEIADTKQVLQAIESTDPIAQKLKLELKEKEAILAAAQGQVDSIVESADPVAEAEKQQLELAKAITTPEAAPAEPTVKESLTVQPTEAAPAKPIVTEEPPVSMVGKEVIPGVTPIPVVRPKAPVEQVVTPPAEVAPPIAEAAPEAAAIDRYTELSRNPKIGTAKERKALEPTVATTTFKTSRGSTYYILPDGKIRRDKYSGTTSYSDQIAFVSPENAEKIKEIRNEYEEGKNASVEITPEVIRFRFNEKIAEVPIASQSPQEGLSPFELSGGRYPHLGDPVVSPAPVTEQAAPEEITIEEAADLGYAQRDPTDVRVFKASKITNESLTNHLEKQGFREGDIIETPTGSAELYVSDSGFAYSWKPKKGRGRDGDIKDPVGGVRIEPVTLRDPNAPAMSAKVSKTKPPKGYVKEGGKYVFKAGVTEQPVGAAAPAAEAVQATAPAVSETITEPVQRDVTKPEQMSFEEYKSTFNKAQKNLIDAESKLDKIKKEEFPKSVKAQLNQSERRRKIESEIKTATQNLESYGGESVQQGVLYKALSENKPVNADVFDKLKYSSLPEGYVKQGDLYVYQPAVSETITEPAQAAELANLDSLISGMSELNRRTQERIAASGIDLASPPLKKSEVKEGEFVYDHKGRVWKVGKGKQMIPSFSQPGIQGVQSEIVQGQLYPFKESVKRDWGWSSDGIAAWRRGTQPPIFATPTPAVSETIAEPAEAPAPEVAPAPIPAPKQAKEDVKVKRIRQFLGENAPQAISEAKNALSKFKTTMIGKRGDNPFQAEPRLRELKNVISLFVANRLNITTKNADQIAEQIILGEPNIVDKATELKPIKAKELNDIEANRSAITRFGYELDDKKTYRHPREAEDTRKTKVSDTQYQTEGVIPEAERFTEDELRVIVNDIFGGKIPDKIEIITDATDPNKEFKAAYSIGKGTITYNLAYIAKEDDLSFVTNHELGHFILGDPKFQVEMARLFDSLPADIQEKLKKAIDEAYAQEGLGVRAEETIVFAFGEILENAPDGRNILQRFLDAIRDAINRLFKTEGYIPRNPKKAAAAILMAARNRFERGEFIKRPNGSVVNIAPDIRRMAVKKGQGENVPIEPEAKTITEGLVQGIDIGKENNMPINNKIESHIKNFAFVRGIFESASDRLRRAKFTKLATAIDDYYDQAQRRLGFANKILLPAFEEYSKQSKATKAKIDEEVQMFFAAQENKRDTDEFFDELNPITQKIVTSWQKFGEESGKENQRIGIKVYDKGLQRWRPIGRIEKFWPRVLKPEYKRALMEPDKYQKEYNEIVEALMKSGRIETPEEAEVFISEYQGTGSQNDYFSGIEVARGQAFPEELYDYSTQVMTDYVARWAQHSSRIEQFGQKLGENSKTLWDRSRESTRDRRTIDYITAAQERVEGYYPNDPIVKGMATLNIWASGLQLGNPASSMLNFFGGTTLNAMVGQPGAFSSYLSSFVELRKLGRELKDAREKGIVSRDLMNIIGDYQVVLEYNRLAQAGQKTTDFLLKWSGFTPIEQVVRTQSMIIGKSFLRKTLSSLSKNPNSSFSKRSLAWLNRNNIDADKLIVEQGTGPETDKLLRYFANISQGSYTIAQTPIFIDTPIGRFLFKYQKFSTQVMRQSWKNTFEPAWKAVTNKNESLQLPDATRQLLYRLRLAEAKELGDNRKITLDEIPKKVTKAEGKALTIIPVMMWLGSAYVGGEVILRLRDMLFGVLMKGPGYEDIIKAFEDDEDDDELYLSLERAWYNLIGMGALGLIGNYAQFFMDWQDRERVKNPFDPPALGIFKETATFIQNAVDQGKITLGDINNYLNRTLSAYRVSQRLYQTAASGLGYSKAPTVAEEMFRREVASINKYARRWAESAGLEYRTRRPSDLPTSKMTPINRKIASYLQRGEPGAAVAYAKEYLNSLPKKERANAIQSMESGARFRKPFRLGNGPMNESEKIAFKKWLKEKVSKEDFDKFQKLDSSYQKTYNLFLNGLPNK